MHILWPIRRAVLFICALSLLLLAADAVASSGWQQGFDFRNTSTFVTDPPGSTYVLSSTLYPTTVNGVTFGWVSNKYVGARDRNSSVDPRLAGINYVSNGSPATFYVDLPAAGIYTVALAMGDLNNNLCSVQCQVQFLDGSTVLATVLGSQLAASYFYDANGNVWSKSNWPTKNLSQQLTLSGTRLTVLVATNQRTGDNTPIAYLGVTQGSFTPSITPSSLSVSQNTQGTSTLTTTLSGGFNNSVSLSASGVPTGTTVSFTPQTIPAPGSGSSSMTITVGSNTPLGTYPITVTSSGGVVQQNTTFTLTVLPPPNFTISASPPSLSVAQGNQGTSTITTTIISTFNSSITLSATGVPSGTSVSFNPQPIPAPGNGSSSMTITVGGNTPPGTYPITVTGNGGGIQQNTTVTLTVFIPPNFTISASPPSLSIAQGNQGTSTIATTIVGSFNSSISLSASGLPTGTSVSFNPQPIPPPGNGSSSMIISVGNNTPLGTYPITVTGNGGGIQQNTTVTLTVVAPSWGFDFRNTSTFVTDPPGSTYVLSSTLYPTTVNGVTFGWVSNKYVQARDRTASVDPRLAGTNFVSNSSPATFYVDLPAPGIYTVALAMGDLNNSFCSVQCQVQFLDGSTVLATVTGTKLAPGYFYDASGNVWSKSNWPTKNLSQQLTLSGTRLTVLVGTNQHTGDYTEIAYLGVTQGSFTPSITPSSLSVSQNTQGTSTLTTTLSGGFNNSVSLSASGVPTGTTVSFTPQTIPAPGSGSSSMTITVGSNTPLGTYPITVTSSGGVVQQNTTFTLTVLPPPNFTISASPPSLSIAQGNQGTSTITTTISGGFSNDINLSASGVPGGTTVSFTPQTIPAPGAGSSTMTIMVGVSTPTGIYPITVTGSGGGVQQNTTVTLTVVAPANFTITASPPSLSIAQGNQGTSTITTTISGGFNNDISLSASGLPTGTSVSFNPQPIPPPGNGSSSMIISVGNNTPLGTYPITVTGNGGGIQQNTTVTLTVVAPSWGFDFRNTSTFVTDPPGSTYVLSSTLYPTTVNGVTFGWVSNKYVQARDRTASVDPRLAGTNFVSNSSPATFYVDLPAPGIYTVALAMGDLNNSFCSVQCQVQFLDGSTVLATVTGTKLAPGYFYDASGNVWSKSNWPTKNLSQQLTLSGTRLTVLVGTNQHTGDYTEIAYLGVTQGSFTPSITPSSLSVSQNTQGTSTLTTTLSGGFNNSVSLSASGVPTGTTVSFTPQTIPAPGSGSSSMTITVGSNTPLGTYPITVTSSGGVVQQNTTFTLTVLPPPNFTISASPPSLSIAQGNQGTSTITTTISGGFSNDINLSASGVPGGTTVSFTPQTIPAPGAGSSTMTIMVGVSTPTGIYPITVTGSGGGVQQNTTVTLTVVAPANFTITASPPSLSIAQGNQGTSTITTTISGGFNNDISLSASGLPTGTSVSFNPQPIPPPGNGSSSMIISVGNNTPLGTYPITVTGNGGGTQQNTTVTLTVTQFVPPDFTIALSPSSVTVQQGFAGGSTVTTTILGQFNGPVDLSASGVPTGTTVSFNPQTIPAPGAGSSAMTITVGSSTPLGTYPITVTGNGGGSQHSATLNLIVTSWTQGFDFRNTAGFVNDPSSFNYVLPATTYPTIVNGVTFGWTTPDLVQGDDRSTLVDPRLAGINSAQNGAPATFYVDLPSPGTYNLALAMGDDGYAQCGTQCQVQFFDGNMAVATVSGGPTNQGYFYDAMGNNWSDAAWPTSNLSQQVTLAGSRLTVVVGTNNATGDLTPIASLGVTQIPNFTITASPSSLSIAQGNQGTSIITTTISGGFSSDVNLSASGVPGGTTVSFTPQTIPAPGAGSSTMTITVGVSTPTGVYPITVTGSGGGVKQNTTVTLTVVAPPNFTITATPASLSVAQGNQGTSSITTTISGGFNNDISLSASGLPTGTTVSFNPQTIPVPGAGSSSMTITVGNNTPPGSYPITVTGNGGGIQQNTTVTLTVTAPPNFAITASPSSLSVVQGNQDTSTITTTVSGGFNSSIALSASGCLQERR